MVETGELGLGSELGLGLGLIVLQGRVQALLSGGRIWWKHFGLGLGSGPGLGPAAATASVVQAGAAHYDPKAPHLPCLPTLPSLPLQLLPLLVLLEMVESTAVGIRTSISARTGVQRIRVPRWVGQNGRRIGFNKLAR